MNIRTNTLSKVIRLREWSPNWNRLQIYNGFTHEERVRGWKLTHYLRDLKILEPYPKRCSICDGSDQVTYHGENYYAPDRVKAVCKSCHMIIHKRFNNPEPFLKLVREYAVGDKEDAWFTSLTLTSFDLAESLRTKFGEVITDLPQGLKNRGIITIEDCEWLSTIL